MVLSKCGSFGNGFFQMVENEPTGSNYKQMFIQCSGCGVPVGVTDYYDTNSQIKKLEAKIESLERALSQIDYNIRVIASRLQ